MPAVNGYTLTPFVVENNIAYQPLQRPPVIASCARWRSHWTGHRSIWYHGRRDNLRMSIVRTSRVVQGIVCNSTYDVCRDKLAELGTNTYTNPAFNNTTDLLANRLGIPNCTGFENTTECMGWNASTSTLTNPSIIYDLQPTAVGTTGKGYQLSSTVCDPSTTDELYLDYPRWLKGIVYLHWDGTQLWENPGLVTKPCGL